LLESQIMVQSYLGFTRLITLVALFWPVGVLPGQQAEDDKIVVEMKPCKGVTRPTAKIGSVLAVLTQSQDKLVHRGTIKVEGKDTSIYLPRERKHTIENTDSDHSKFSNTSTHISIDQNADGQLEEYESFPANLPIRILDSMFKVTEIAEDGSSLTLARHDGPLSGVVLNRRCPDFSFQTVTGGTISNKSILGKVTILDIWAVT